MKASPQTLTIQLAFAYGLILILYLGCALATETGEEMEFEMEDNEAYGGTESIADHLTVRNNAITEITLKIPYLNLYLPSLRFHTEKHNESAPFDKNQCNTDLENLGKSLTDKWVLPLLDSYGKPSSGITQGAVFWPGNYDQCIRFKAPMTKLFPSGFKGRYCLLKLSPINVSLAIQTGICVPNSCESTELNNDYSQLKAFLDIIPVFQNYTEYFPRININCLPENVPLNSSSIVCIVLLAIVFTITIAGTTYDAYIRYYKTKETIPISFTNNTQSEENTITSINDSFISTNNDQREDDQEVLVRVVNSNIQNWVVEALLCFSVLKNGKSLLDTSDRAGQLNCLHGIRFISITWVILGHTYVFGAGQFANIMEIMEYFPKFSFQAVVSATFSVDTFFLLRLTPVYMVVLFAFATLFNFIGDGPYWGYSNQQSNVCTKFWWRNLFYINNFPSSSEMCMGWSWYLANDTQFFMISPLFLVLLKSQRSTRRYMGLGIIAALLLSSWIAGIAIYIINKLPNTFESALTGDTSNNFFDYIYDKPYTRIGPYLIGCLLGFAIIELKGTSKILSSRWVIIGWCAAIALALTDVYGLYKSHLGLTSSAFYTSLSRSAWALAVSWVIFASLTGHGGVVDKFLSWKFFFPLSRLTYCAYLIHPIVMYFYYQTLRYPISISNSVVAVHYLGFTVLTYGLALITSLTFEAPVIKLEKLIRQGPSMN